MLRTILDESDNCIQARNLHIHTVDVVVHEHDYPIHSIARFRDLNLFSCGVLHSLKLFDCFLTFLAHLQTQGLFVYFIDCDNRTDIYIGLKV